MSVFYMDFAEISDAIKEYDNLIEKLESCNNTLVATASAVDVDIFAGADADLLRENWGIQSSDDIPYAIEKITSIKDALAEARTEFKECKKYCINFANAFDISTYMVHPTGMNGILKCDYDDASLSIGYCNNIIDECVDISDNLDGVKRKFSGFHGSYDDIYTMIDKFKTDSEKVCDVISTHKNDINTYASMVATADDNLTNKLRDIMGDELENIVVQDSSSGVEGLLGINPYDVDIDWTSAAGIMYAQIIQLENEKKYYEDLLLQNPGYSMAEYYYQELERINKELRELDEETFDEMAMEIIYGCKRASAYAYTYDYICGLDYPVEQKAEILLHWQSIDDLGDYEIRGKEMPPWWMESHLTVPEELAVTENNVITYNESENAEKLKKFYYENYYICDCISGMGNQMYDGRYIDSKMIISGEIPGEQCLYERWFDYMYGDMREYVEGTSTIRSLKYAIDKQIGCDALNTNIGIYSVNDNYESMTLNYAVNLCTDNAYRDSVDNHQLTFVANPIFWEIKGNINLSEDDKEALRESIESVHENVLKSNYVILWSYGRDDVNKFEEQYINDFKFLNGDVLTDDWTDEVWERFEEENAFSRASQTRYDELVYYEGVPKEQIVCQRFDSGDKNSKEPNSLYVLWKDKVSTLKNVGTIDIFSHAEHGFIVPYKTSGTSIYDWYDGTIEKVDWSENMNIGPRLNFHGCHTINDGSENGNTASTQNIANYFGVPVQGNKYSGSFSKDKLKFKEIEDFVPYDRSAPIYLNTYNDFEIEIDEKKYGIKSRVNTTVYYSEEY